MDNIQASPQNELLAGIAAALRGGRASANAEPAGAGVDFVAKMFPMLKMLRSGGNKLGDTLFGRSPEGVAQMSYGEPPVTLPTLAKPIGFPKNEEGGYRAMDQLEGLTALPVGLPKVTGGAAAMGQLIPVMPQLTRYNADKVASAALRSRVTTAEAVLKRGGTDQDIWDAARLAKNLGSDTGNPSQARWLHEILPSSPNNRILGGKALDPERNYTARDIFTNDQELFRQYPKLGDISVKINPDMPASYNGAYRIPEPGETGTIFLKPSLEGKELTHVADHELSHGIMQNMGQIQNRGFGVHPPNPETIDLLKGAVKSFEGSSSIPPELLNELRKTQLQQRVQLTNPYAAWLMSSGEALAEQSAFRTAKAGRLGLSELRRAPEFSPSYISDQASIAAGSAGWPVSSQGKNMTQEAYNSRLLEELRRQAAKSR